MSLSKTMLNEESYQVHWDLNITLSVRISYTMILEESAVRTSLLDNYDVHSNFYIDPCILIL